MLTQSELAARKEGIGGSDVSALLGLSPWKSALDVYQEKTQELPPQEITQWQELGHLMENQILIPYYQQKYNKVIEFPSTIKHKKYPFMLAHVDGLDVENNRIIECKNVGGYKNTDKWGDAGTDQVPYTYLLQCIHYMEVLEVEETYLVALFGGNCIEVFIIKRNEELINKVIEKEKHFWENHVVPEIPPEPSTLTDIKSLYPYSTESKIAVANTQVLTDIIEYRELEQRKCGVEKEMAVKKVSVQKFMKDAEILVSQNEEQIATFKQTKKGSRTFRLKKNFFQ